VQDVDYFKAAGSPQFLHVDSHAPPLLHSLRIHTPNAGSGPSGILFYSLPDLFVQGYSSS
jgi:hypothetical protein